MTTKTKRPPLLWPSAAELNRTSAAVAKIFGETLITAACEGRGTTYDDRNRCRRQDRRPVAAPSWVCPACREAS